MIALPQQLGQLENFGLLHLAQVEPELEYLFRHGLIQDAAYSSLLRADRKKLHQRVGECLEATYPQRLDELAPLLAQHFAEAGDEARALQYFIRAGDSAARAYANSEALAHYSQAIKLANPLPLPEHSSSIPTLYTQRGRVLELLARYAEAAANYLELEHWAQTHRQPAAELLALMRRTTLYCTSTPLFNLAEGERLSEQAVTLAHTLGDQTAEAKILWNRINLYRFAGNMPQALICATRALTLARQIADREQLAFILNDITHVYFTSAMPAEGQAALRESSALWRALNNQPMLADSLGNAALYFTMTGRYEEAIAASTEAFNISRAINNIWGQSYSRSFVGRAYWELGEVDQALQVMEASIRAGELSGFLVAQMQTRASLAELYGYLGAPEKGLALTTTALALAQDRMPVFQQFILSIMASLYQQQGDLDSAQRLLDQAERLEHGPGHAFVRIGQANTRAQVFLAQGRYPEALALFEQTEVNSRPPGFHLFLTEILYGHGLALLRQGDWSAAQATLTEARELAQTLNSRWGLWRILAALADLATRNGDTAQAQTLRAEAREHLTFILAHISAPDLRESFLNLKEVRELTR